MQNVKEVLAIELLTACQALDFAGAGSTGSFVRKIFNDFREQVSFVSVDRVLHDDILKAINFIENYELK